MRETKRSPAGTALTGLVGCAGGGVPSGFSKGDHWTFPLVGPLEDGLLIAPAMVHGKGPYLFAIDPDASVSAIDQQAATEAGLTISRGSTVVDETGMAAMLAVGLIRRKPRCRVDGPGGTVVARANEPKEK